MKTHYSILELLEMKLENLPTTKMGLGSKVVRESWPFIEVAGKGGKGGKRREYAPPPEVLKLIQAKMLNEVLGGLSDLPELQPSQRLCGQTDLPPQAQRWLERYPQSNEYKALSKRAMLA